MTAVEELDSGACGLVVGTVAAWVEDVGLET